MTFDEKLTAMQQAKAAAELQFVATVTEARDAYVVAGEAHVAAESAWLEQPTNEVAVAAAAATWTTLNSLREALVTATTTAIAARESTLDDAWAALRIEE